MNWFLGTKEDILNAAGGKYPDGLPASVAQKRLIENGENVLSEKKQRSVLLVLWAQLLNWLIAVLVVASIITILLGEYVDAIIIFIVVAINAILGTIQERKAEKAILGLQKYVALQCQVIRDNKHIVIPASQLVVGDLVLLEPGVVVPADLRLLESNLLQVNESALTGESVPAIKDAKTLIQNADTAVGDCVNMVYMSTIVTNGTAIGVVVAVGMQTEIGKIANLLNVAPRDYTPLEIKLNKLGKQIGLLAIVACVVIFVIGILQNRNVADMFLTAVSLAVAAIPEGLSAIVAIVLAIGVTKMAKQKAIVKKLAAVETLGSVNVICTDKTGTLTENKMTVKKFYFQNHITSISDKTTADTPQFQRLLRAFVLSSNATYVNDIGIGDPTEIALHIFYDLYRNDRLSLIQQTKRLAEFPFDANRKSMSVLVSENNINTVYCKGAVVRLFDICSFISINDQPEPFTEEHKQKIREIANALSDDSLRTLGVAYKIINAPIAPEMFEKDLIFLGLIGMFDPPRVEVKPVIKQAHHAGIHVIMITGDHKNTAFAIAKTLGIATDLKQVMSGHELDMFQKKGDAPNINHITVFARVSPEHKVDIVNNLRAAGNIVAMTGDGVNDAPSLSAADIGIAMGKTGTDVARNAADIILTDDNFKTIISAVEKGRNVYQNIKKSILFLLTCNLGEVIAVFITILIGWYPPFIATQLLWINLITDSLPALALGMDNNDKSLMQRKPRPPKEHILSGYNKWQVVIGGLLIGTAAIAAFYLGCKAKGANPFDKNIPADTIEYARTLAFMVIIVAQLLYTFSVRSGKLPFLNRPVFDNKLLLFSIVLGFLIQLIILFVPYLRNAFHLQMLTASGWYTILILGFLPLIIAEIFKWLLFFQSKK